MYDVKQGDPHRRNVSRPADWYVVIGMTCGLLIGGMVGAGLGGAVGFIIGDVAGGAVGALVGAAVRRLSTNRFRR